MTRSAVVSADKCFQPPSGWVTSNTQALSSEMMAIIKSTLQPTVSSPALPLH